MQRLALNPRLAVTASLLGCCALGILYLFAREARSPASQQRAASDSGPRTGTIESIDFSASTPRSLQLDSVRLPMTNLVSAAQVDSDHLAIVDYGNLYCLRISTNRVSVVGRPPDLRGLWNPTGLAVGNGRLYIANYKGNNIVEGVLDCVKADLRVTSVISSQDSISPENVAISSNGKFLVSANYDGDGVTAFLRGPNGWSQLWFAKDIGLAHGVAIIGDKVYATGLKDRKIYRLSLSSGRVIGSRGSQGPDPLKNQYLWPTGLLNYRGTLLLTDAHTGYVCSIRLDSLATDICFGGSKGGRSGFNMPYGLSLFNGNLLVVSTYSSRILELAPDFTSRRIRAGRDWYWIGSRPVNPDFQDDFLPPTRPFPDNSYALTCVMPLWLSRYTCSYAGLVTANGTFLRFPDAGSILPDLSYYYFVQSFLGNSADDAYFFSPQTSTALNVRLAGGVPYVFQEYLDDHFFGFEQRGSALVSPSHTVQKRDVIARFNRLKAALDAKRDANGVVRSDQYVVGLKKAISASGSALGQQFLDCYLGYLSGSTACDAISLRKLAISFAFDELSKPDTLLDRALIPCMLANAQCGPAVKAVLRD